MENIKTSPDTSHQLSIAEVIQLNNFLDAHAQYKTYADSIPKSEFDMRVVFLFGDDSGKRHELGFDCFGNYEFDGIAFSFNNRLAYSFQELKIQ